MVLHECRDYGFKEHSFFENMVMNNSCNALKSQKHTFVAVQRYNLLCSLTLASDWLILTFEYDQANFYCQ